SKAIVKIGDKTVEAPVGTVVNSKFDENSVKEIAAFKKGVAEDLKVAGYPAKADPAKINKVLTIVLLFWLVLL
ncbi:MFS transporter, partial [Mycobacterium tuberculosis]